MNMRVISASGQRLVSFSSSSRAVASVARGRKSVGCKAVQVAQEVSNGYPAFVPDLVSEISDTAALRLISSMKRVPVMVDSIANKEIGTAYVGPTQEQLAAYPANAPAVVMLHGGFLEQVVKPACGDRPIILLGSSLGGAIALDFAINYPELISRLALIAPQAFIDGIGPMSNLPRPLASLGVSVLKKEWLRQAANQMSYFNKKKMATRDALLVGRLHTHLPGWMEANVAFIRSGGYAISKRLSEVETPTTVLWGRNDEVLDPKLYADKFEATLKNARLVWVEESGHVPHLEQPEFVARFLVEEMELEWIA
eukprot:gene27629-7266_t